MGHLKFGSAASQALSGKMSAVENDEADAAEKEETPSPIRSLAQCRNLAADQGCRRFAISDNLESGDSCEHGNGDFTKTQQIFISIYDY